MDWRDHFPSWTGPRALAHPGSPSGAGGPGRFRRAGPHGGHQHHPAHHRSHAPHPHAPAAQSFDWHRLPIIDQTERVVAVWDAMQRSRTYLPGAIKRATGEELHALIDGLVPGLLIGLGVMAITTLGGAAAGAALGALAGGIGAAPGAVAGATAGAEAGLAILEFLGLTFLVAYIGNSLVNAVGKAKVAVALAWKSVEAPPPRSRQQIDRAGRLLADAMADIFRGVLQGVVAFLLSKGAGAARARMPELVGKLRASKLGAGFATWVEHHAEGLLKNPRLRVKPKPGDLVEPPAGPPAQTPSSMKPRDPAKPAGPKVGDDTKPGEKAKPKGKKPVASDLAQVEANGAKPVRIKQGTNDKVAVMGRNMSYVRAEAAELRAKGYDVEIFDGNNIPKDAVDDWGRRTEGGQRVSDEEVVTTPMYEANKAWAEKLRDQGYTVVDMGDPAGKGPSKFYEIEGDTIFGDSE
jgi:uncharacterized protein DUF6861